LEIKKDNLFIRNAVSSDAEQLCTWWNDGKIMAHAGFPNGLGITAKEISESLGGDTDETCRRHMIELDGLPIGEMNYRNIGSGVAEIGIKICDFSRPEKGLGTTLLAIFIDALFTHYGYIKILLDTNVKNERAQYVYEKKLGFQKLRVNENSWNDQLGKPQSSIDYELLKTDWQSRCKETPLSYQINVLYNDRFPRSNEYDHMWIFKNQMGPHPLWLTEFLVQPFDLKPGMRVLDLGCGKGMTSVFLAREFGVHVYAVDLWEAPDEKWENAKAFNVEHLITPVYADANNLPFAQGFFDAIICVDAYIYFGADEAFLGKLIKFLRTGGQLGMIVPGYNNDISAGIPDYIPGFLGDELWTWHTLAWWRDLWEKDGLVSLDVADTLPNACDLWLRWDTSLITYGMNGNWPDETDDFRMDNGDYIGFIRMVATKM